MHLLKFNDLIVQSLLSFISESLSICQSMDIRNVDIDNLIFHFLIFVSIHPVEKIFSVWHRKTNGSCFNGIDLWIRGLRQEQLNFAAKSGFSGKINRPVMLRKNLGLEPVVQGEDLHIYNILVSARSFSHCKGNRKNVKLRKYPQICHC